MFPNVLVDRLFSVFSVYISLPRKHGKIPIFLFFNKGKLVLDNIIRV